MTAKRAIIIHCWEGYPECCWYPWLKSELEKLEYKVDISLFPNADLPQLSVWLTKLREVVGEPDEELILIGHSIGCATILHYLELLPPGKKINSAILVAPYTDDLGYKELSNFFTTPFDFPKIKTHCAKFVCVHSDNDPYVPMKFADEFREKLGAQIVVKHNAGHMSGALEGDNSCLELPEILENLS